tara:strand:- start:70 stop:519 length:450 start_codon:yes stop_codon:yes gene_type:complete
MALPSSGPISSSQVATEFSVSTTNISLSNLGTQLSTPITAGQPVELANDFYGQSAFSGTSFTNVENGSNAASFEDAESACSAAPEPQYTATRYHDGTGTTPVNGDKVYKTNSTSDPIGNGYFAFNAGRSNFSYEVTGGTGTVSNRTVCE